MWAERGQSAVGCLRRWVHLNALHRIALSVVSSLARLRTRSTMARRALASEMRTNALLSSRPSRLRRNCTIAFSAGVSGKPAGTTRGGAPAGGALLYDATPHAHTLSRTATHPAP